jgi:hypothetical protein
MDKSRLCLLKHRDAISKKNEWVTPFGLLLSFGTTLVAADFKDFVLTKSVWQALFVMASILCAGWFCRAAALAWKHRNAGDVETIVMELAAQNASSAQPERRDSPRA